jgi:hypothetical protein
MTIVVNLVSTATTTYFNNNILNWVMPDVPGAPLQLVNNAIRDAVIELCERALIWRQELQQILVLGPTATTTTATQIVGDTQVSVSDCTNFFVGDTLTVGLDDFQSGNQFIIDQNQGLVWRGHVLTVSATSGPGVITLDGALQGTVDIGAPVTKIVYLYSITLPTGTAFVKGLEAWLNDAPIDPLPQDDLDNEMNNTSFGFVGLNWRTDVNLPTRFYFIDDNTVGLALAPNAGGNLRILAALKPTRASTTFPNWIFERHIEAIAHGAKAKLMLIPKKPYSDQASGAFHLEQFNALIGEARIQAARARSRAPLRTHTVFSLH